jgi:hypothetical protein
VGGQRIHETALGWVATTGGSRLFCILKNIYDDSNNNDFYVDNFSYIVGQTLKNVFRLNPKRGVILNT